MSWAGRIFAVFSIAWSFLALAALLFVTWSNNSMWSDERSWWSLIVDYLIVIGFIAVIWYGVYRLFCWFDERE